MLDHPFRIDSLERKLLILALILYLSAVFLPWMTESYVYRSWSWPSGVRHPENIRRQGANTDNLLLWSFMIVQEREMHLFEKFWFHEPLDYMPYHSPLWTGLYNGWALIFVLQIITVICYVAYLKNWKVTKIFRGNNSTWLLILPLATILLSLYQLFIQREIFYQEDLQWYSGQPNIGFWVSVLSFATVLIATLKASEQPPLKKILGSLKKMSKITWLALIILSIMVFFFVQELEFQGGATKLMLVVNMRDSQKIRADPQLWESHFSRITLIAGLFRARIIKNWPEYAYCRIVVPLISYRILATILSSMGYEVGEPIFLHVLLD